VIGLDEVVVLKEKPSLGGSTGCGKTPILGKNQRKTPLRG
jgi:hypothetical protein